MPKEEIEPRKGNRPPYQKKAMPTMRLKISPGRYGINRMVPSWSNTPKRFPQYKYRASEVPKKYPMSEVKPNE